MSIERRHRIIGPGVFAEDTWVDGVLVDTTVWSIRDRCPISHGAGA